jgi:hypothetical protein
VKKTINIAASVRARLLNRARAEGRPFSELLQYYAMERFLFRLSKSAHAQRFVLKGALMFQLWGGPATRATKDIDLLGRATTSIDDLTNIMRRWLTDPVSEDGLLFDPRTVTGEAIRLDAKYDGIRVRCCATLSGARVSLQIDVGFGDVVVPGATEIQYPTLLEFEPPRLLGYSPESAIAEKFQAIVQLDMGNTRLKDFLDIWTLAQGHAFSGVTLSEALEATFHRRGTPLPSAVPVALTPAFHSSLAKQVQWRAYLRKARVQGEVPELAQVAEKILLFLMPVVESVISREHFRLGWPPGGLWENARM